MCTLTMGEVSYTMHHTYHSCLLLVLLLLLPCSILEGIEVVLPALEQQGQQQHQQQLGEGLDHDHQQQCTRASGNTISSSSSSSSSGGYVCVLDDDVALHPLSLCQLVDEMQADPELFMATGGCKVFEACSSACICGDKSNSAGRCPEWCVVPSCLCVVLHDPQVMATGGCSLQSKKKFGCVEE
jgi:hypothetical protein